jgi:hypothetical protein
MMHVFARSRSGFHSSREQTGQSSGVAASRLLALMRAKGRPLTSQQRQSLGMQPKSLDSTQRGVEHVSPPDLAPLAAATAAPDAVPRVPSLMDSFVPSQLPEAPVPSSTSANLKLGSRKRGKYRTNYTPDALAAALASKKAADEAFKRGETSEKPTVQSIADTAS